MEKATKTTITATINAVASGEKSEVYLYHPRLHGGCQVVYRASNRGVVRYVLGPDGQDWGRRLVRAC
jgi:hypothetical protein